MPTTRSSITIADILSKTLTTTEHGGNGHAIDFGGTYRFNESFSQNFGLNLQAIVPDGESLDDAVVTGTGTFGVAVGYDQGGTSTLNIQLQTSSGNPSTGSGGHEYISFVSSLAPQSGADFSFDIDFDINPPEPPVDDPDPPLAASTTGDSDDAPPPPNFSFTYNTRNAEGGSSILLYSKTETFGDPSGNVTITEELTASGTLTFSTTFGFSLDGISLTVHSSGSGSTEYKSSIVNRAALPDFSQPTDWTGAWHYPEMRTEVTVTTTGSFSADVTLGFSLTAGLNLDVAFSTDIEIVSSELTRTDWIYWEASGDGVNNYWAVGYNATVRTTTLEVNGNLADGFDINLEQDETATGDSTSGGTSLVGSPITTGPTRVATHWDGAHETVYLEVEDLFGHSGPFTLKFSMYGRNTTWTHRTGFLVGAPGQIELIVQKGTIPEVLHPSQYPDNVASGSAQDAIRLIREVSSRVYGDFECEIRNGISAAQVDQARPNAFYGRGQFGIYSWENHCRHFADFCHSTYTLPPEIPFPVPFGW